MATANNDIFGSKSSRTRDEMEKRKGYRYFYVNDGKWEHDKTHFQWLTKFQMTTNNRPWNNNFGNTQSLGSLLSLEMQNR
jgi:hypothetical protein